jgi:hypothetical protein
MVSVTFRFGHHSFHHSTSAGLSRSFFQKCASFYINTYFYLAFCSQWHPVSSLASFTMVIGKEIWQFRHMDRNMTNRTIADVVATIRSIVIVPYGAPSSCAVYMSDSMTATQLNATPDSMEETFVTGNHVQLIEGNSERSSCLLSGEQTSRKEASKSARHSRADRGGI